MLNKIGGSDLRMLDHFQMGPNLVRGFAPNGIGPRDINPFGTRDALGGTKYWGASFELQMPFWFLPKEVGLKGSVYADAGGLWDYKGPTSWAPPVKSTCPAVFRRRSDATWPTPGTCLGLQYDDRQCRPHLGRCRLDLGVAVRSAALRLCGAADQGAV